MTQGPVHEREPAVNLLCGSGDVHVSCTLIFRIAPSSAVCRRYQRTPYVFFRPTGQFPLEKRRYQQRGAMETSHECRQPAKMGSKGIGCLC